MIASHSDSPTFRVKKQTAGVKGYTKAEVEGYGGMIYSSWLDRPLSMAGRVIVKKIIVSPAVWYTQTKTYV